MQKNFDLYNLLQKYHIIKDITNSSYDFYDEPKPFSYDVLISSKIDNLINESNYVTNIEGLTATGISFFSDKLALLKCLNETVERICLCTYLQSNVFIKKNVEKDVHILNPIKINDKVDINNNFGWVKGYKLSYSLAKEKFLIPAQLVYINYFYNQEHNEQFIASPISTGGASGYTYEETLLRGIFEVIERDSIMNVYLGKIPVPNINLKSIHNSRILFILEKFKRYKLSPTIFYILNDFGIPTYLTVLKDLSGVGLEFSLGMKSSLDNEAGIIGSLEESMITRFYSRKVQMKSINNTVKELIKSKDITTIEKRSQFWTKKNAIRKLNFLNKTNNSIDLSETINFSSIKSNKATLEYTLKLISSMGFDVYYVDITLPFLKESNIKVYKIIIPQLQPMYLNEAEKNINLKRLRDFSLHFKKINKHINNVPHPYL